MNKLESDLKSFWHHRIMDVADSKKISIAATIELTANCNLKCKHCYVAKENKPELTLDEIKDIIHQLSKMGCLVLALTGGEIFTRTDLFEIIQYAREKLFFLLIQTNGTFITKKTVKRLKELQVGQVMIALYGPDRDIHDRFTQVRGSFDKAIRGLNHLIEGKVRVSVVCTLTDINYSGYRRLKKMIERKGIKIFFNPRVVRRRNGLEDPTFLTCSPIQLREFFQSEKGVFYRKYMEVDGKTSVRDKLLRGLCRAGHSHIGITAYGDIVPCLLFPESVGNLKRKSLFEIWHTSTLFINLRKLKWIDIPKCSRCKYLVYCRRCSAEALLETRNILAPSKVDCKQARVIASLTEEGRIIK